MSNRWTSGLSFEPFDVPDKSDGRLVDANWFLMESLHPMHEGDEKGKYPSPIESISDEDRDEYGRRRAALIKQIDMAISHGDFQFIKNLGEVLESVCEHKKAFGKSNPTKDLYFSFYELYGQNGVPPTRNEAKKHALRKMAFRQIEQWEEIPTKERIDEVAKVIDSERGIHWSRCFNRLSDLYPESGKVGRPKSNTDK